MHVQIDDTPSLEAYPNLSAAASMLGVSRSTLSRRENIAAEHRGERDLVVPAKEVLRLARIYRKRSINDVAQALIDHATEADPDSRGRVEKEVEEDFASHSVAAEQAELLRLAQRLLTPAALAAVKACLAEPVAPLASEIEGLYPVTDTSERARRPAPRRRKKPTLSVD